MVDLFLKLFPFMGYTWTKTKDEWGAGEINQAICCNALIVNVRIMNANQFLLNVMVSHLPPH